MPGQSVAYLETVQAVHNHSRMRQKLHPCPDSAQVEQGKSPWQVIGPLMMLTTAFNLPSYAHLPGCALTQSSFATALQDRCQSDR